MQVRHALAPYAQLQTSDILERAVGESDTARVCRMGALPLTSPTQAHQLDATLREEYGTDLFEVNIKPEKCAESVYSTSQNPYGTVVGRKFLSHLKPGVIKDLTKSIRVQLDSASLATHCQKDLISH